MLQTKICTRCKQELPLESFYKGLDKKDNLSYRCKTCANIQTRAWQRRNRERINRQHKQAVKNRLVKGLCRFCINERLTHSNSYCEQHWYVNIAKYHLGSGSNKAAALLKQKMELQKYTCPYTGERLVPALNCQIDHKLPISRFPEKRYAIDNLEWVSTTINQAKHALTKDEFIKLCQHVVDYIQRVSLEAIFIEGNEVESDIELGQTT